MLKQCRRLLFVQIILRRDLTGRTGRSTGAERWISLPLGLEEHLSLAEPRFETGRAGDRVREVYL